MNWKFFIPFYGIYAVYKANPPVGKIWYLWTFLISFVALSLMTGKDSDGNHNTSGSSNSAQETTTTKSEEEIIAELPKVGTPVQTEYFEVLVKSYKLSPVVYTGNQFADLKKEEGNKYLIIDVTFKNISDESRNIINEGSIFLKVGGKEYEYDKSEMVMHDGFGVILNQINPMVKKSTKLVYKVPEEFKGRIFWQPPRSFKRIYLGEVK